MAKNRISETELTTVSPITVYEGSRDALTIDPKYVRYITTKTAPSYISSANLTADSSGFEYSVSDEEYESPGTPHMEDIAIVKNSTYVDKKNNVRTKIVFRVRNSSGEKIKGVDARISIITGDDQ